MHIPYPTSCVQVAQRIPAQLPATWLELGGWVTATVLRAEIGPNWLQFTAQDFPWKLQAFNRLQISKIVTSDRFCQYNFCLDRDRFLAHPNSLCSLKCLLPELFLQLHHCIFPLAMYEGSSFFTSLPTLVIISLNKCLLINDQVTGGN